MSLADLVLSEISSKLKKWLRDSSEYEYRLDFEVEGEPTRQVWIPDQVVDALMEGIGTPDRLPELVLNSLLPPGKEVEIKLRRIPQGSGAPDEIGFFGRVGGATLRWFLRGKLLKGG